MKHILRLMSFTFPIGIVLCIFAQMVVANQMIVLSNQLGQINHRINELSDQNDFLEQKVAANSSIQKIALEAKKEGFVDATTYLAFDDESFPVAIKR